MTRVRGWLDIAGGIGTLWLARRLPQAGPWRDPLMRPLRILNGGALIVRGVGRGLMSDPSSRTAQQWQRVGLRTKGWVELIRGLLALRIALRPPQMWPERERSLRLMLILGGSAGLVSGLADGVLPNPEGTAARRLRRIALVLESVALLLAMRRLVALRPQRVRRGQPD